MTEEKDPGSEPLLLWLIVAITLTIAIIACIIVGNHVFEK